jgi:PKD repeat protein
MATTLSTCLAGMFYFILKPIKTEVMFKKTKMRLTTIMFAFVMLTFHGFSINPFVSNYLINLSEGEEGPGYDDKVPEIVVSGNTVHAAWVQSVATREAYLYYRRSTDLGETWEAPKVILAFKDRGKAIQVENRRLAVDGDVVHICAADYDYDDNGTGRLHYFRSQNGGASFESERIIAATSGGYKSLDRSFIKASNGKVAVAYQGTGDKNGTWLLFSSNGGTTFSDTKLPEESTYVYDLFYDGEQVIVLHGHFSTSYGYITVGKIWVSTSQNGTAFTTSKISETYMKDDVERERCYVIHNYHYSPKITRSGNYIHAVFTGYTEGDVWTTFYARSTNGGNSFEAPVDMEAITPESLQNGSETVAAKNGHVYFLASTTNHDAGNRFYFAYSHDNGNNFTEPRRIMNPDVYHVGKASLPGITIDPTDETGKTLYLTGNWLFTTRSVDGGETFSGSTSLAPFLESNIINMAHSYMNSYMKMDNEGGMHWITQARWRDGNDQDIFYRNVKKQPEPGTSNKAYFVESLAGNRQARELLVVPSSETIQFDSAMTAEAWVKFHPDTEARFSILAKVDGPDLYDNNPSGYHLGFRQDKGAIYVNAGMKTDNDAVVNWSEIDLNDNLWHHIALTYDAKGGLNNFKLYINGLLHKEQTLLGAIIREDGMLMIGSRQMGDGYYRDAKYHLDDVRLWNRALSQEELLENQTRKLTGEEEGLTLFINFDDTFKDISGNGNDGISVYKGTLHESDFNPPVPAFEMYQSGNSVSFNNKTSNATSWLWNFGDDGTSEQGNPKYGYSTPGEYSISLLAKNANSVTAAAGHATIEGIDRVEPATAGAAGIVTVTVFGGGLASEGSTLLLRRNGAEIAGNDLYSPAPGQLAGRFLMNGAELGEYDVVFRKNGAELILEEGFKVVEATLPEPWVSVSGRGMALIGMRQTYAISYGNKGNVDALGVPLNIVISDLPDLKVEFFDFKVEASEYMKTHTPEIVELMDTLYHVVEDYFEPGHHARFYPLFVPILEANSSHSVRIRITSTENFYIEAWTNDPFFEFVDTETKSAAASQDDWPDEKTKLNACIALSAANAASSVAMDALGMVLPVDCVYDFATFAFNPWDAAKPEMNEPSVFNNWGYSLASAAISCIGDLSPIKAIKIGIKIASIVNNMYQGYMAHQDCLNNFDPRYKNRKRVVTVASFDPNEMVGPSGHGDQNYIARYPMMPYTILFENKSEATAPAHIVIITDTLDLSVFDISEFGFSSFGWADTTFSPPGNKLKEFSMDIDMRPELELITRVSGKLDTVTGVIKWEFLSLNPETMDLEEDPFLGFLPPNVTPPEGDGFVSFSVGLKEELWTNDEIRNQATIVFDANEPIITNEYLNTLDMDEPQSRVYPLETTSVSSFMVDWTGTDEGSGIGSYTIYVMENDTLLYPWLTNTTEITAEFIGEVGSTYKFYSIATDNVGHRETTPNDYDTQTTVVVNLEEFERVKEELAVWPNPVKDNLRVTFSHAPCGMYVVELVSATGSVKHSQLYEDRHLQNGISVNVSDYPPGQYVLRVVFGNRVETRKVVVK